MLKKTKKLFIILGLALFIGGAWIPTSSTVISTPFSPQAVYAATDPCHPELNKDGGGQVLTSTQRASCEACTKAGLDPKKDNNSAVITCVKENVIVKDLNIIVNVLTGLVGLAVVGTIILGGIQYSLAGGKPDATVNAKKRIMNGFIALVAYLFVFGFLQWLVPGGVFK